MFVKKDFKRFNKNINKKIFDKVHLYFDFLLICNSPNLNFFSDVQFEMSKKLISKILKPYGKDSFYFFVKPFFFLTSKPSESRMGGGKGSRSFKIFPLKKGQVFMGFRNVPFLELVKLINLLSSKLPFKICLMQSNY